MAKMRLLVAAMFLSTILLHGQSLSGFTAGKALKNGKFYCRIDTSHFYLKEEWTLKLFSVNMLELVSTKTSDTDHHTYRTHIKKVKVQFYTGTWEQKGDTMLVSLDFNADSVKNFEDYELKFIFKENDLTLLKTTQLKNFDYSDIFYGKSVWIKKPFIQTRKRRILAKF